MYLKVALNTTADSLKGIFRLELARSINETIEAIQQGRHILYHVYFPSDVGLPTLSAIWFNDQRYCLGPGASNGSIVANIELGHIVYPLNEEPLLQNFQSWYRNSSSYRINNPNYNSNTECGITSYYSDTTNMLIPNGANSLPGQWPWVVAIYAVKTSEYSSTYKYRCSGSILTDKHVLTVAHCVVNVLTNIAINPNKLEVAMGIFDLTQLHADGTASRKVLSLKIHPDYVPYSYSGDSNLAILILRSPVEFNPLIRPICLWSGSANLENVVNRTGYVVGWGVDAIGHRDVNKLRMIRATIVSQETCNSSDTRYARFISKRTFCAGSSDDKGPCRGDSGTGLMLPNNITGRYQLRGVVSGSIGYVNDTFECDPRKYVIYVDVAKYIPWIKQEISV
ncbi:PREDICTED: serine protease gd-like isoform X2 [Vollenhovia emeryi]|nr:PREDICTED: serine protease gd-like isoform X2 [Vollenhovia emeryi]XP_011866174.1 PREDICTED: serine protease gd-like isoform X2 [Vollenhovia emeryi]XP_011866175.1 PREDICTED: serine protease gd-like isoform X2 [Vollenhovia emeryi]